MQLGPTGGGRFLLQPGVEVEDLADQFDQLVDAVIVSGIFDRREEAVLPAETEDVPGVDQCPALDGPLQEVLDLRQQKRRLVQPAAIDGQVGGRQAAVDLAAHPRRGDRHGMGLADRGLRIAHLGEKPGQVDVLQLLRSPPGQHLVEVLPRAAQRLPQGLGLFPQPHGLRTAQPPEETLVEGVAVAGDDRQELGDGHGRIVRIGPAAADARAHEHRSRQHGGGLEQHFLVRDLPSALDPLPKGVQGDLLQHEAAIAALVVDLVRIPAAEVMVRPAVDGMIEVQGPRVEA